jgi:hypothetical protein
MTPMDWMDQIYEHFAVPVTPFMGNMAITLALALGVLVTVTAWPTRDR